MLWNLALFRPNDATESAGFCGQRDALFVLAASLGQDQPAAGPWDFADGGGTFFLCGRNRLKRPVLYACPWHQPA